MFAGEMSTPHSAGTRTCALTFGYRTAEQLRLTEPDVMIDRFEQLKEVIE